MTSTNDSTEQPSRLTNFEKEVNERMKNMCENAQCCMEHETKSLCQKYEDNKAPLENNGNNIGKTNNTLEYSEVARKKKQLTGTD
jgi:hypothetical protein